MVRKNKPQLRDPSLAHTRAFNEDMGVVSARTVGQRTDDLAAEKIRGNKPVTVTGTHADGSATIDLVQKLHEAGAIVDETTLGLSPPAAAPTNNPVFTGQITVLGIASASPTLIAAGFFQVEEIDPDRSTHPATVTATPVATFPGAGTAPTRSISGGNMSGNVDITIGAGPAAGDILRVNYGINRASAGNVVFSARSNSAAADIAKVKVISSDLTGFTLTAVNALGAGNLYQWNYVVM